jgi:hypothetical protein
MRSVADDETLRMAKNREVLFNWYSAVRFDAHAERACQCYASYTGAPEYGGRVDTFFANHDTCGVNTGDRNAGPDLYSGPFERPCGIG